MARKQKAPVEPQQPLAGRHADSRARVRPGPDSSVVDRVAWCTHLMVSWEWYGTSTIRELAALWGMTESTVRNYSSEASRNIKRSPEELEAERAAHASNAERIMQDAYSRTSNITGLPDYGAALKANEQAAAFKGLTLKSKVELTGKDGGPLALIDVGKLSDAELNEYLTGAGLNALLGEGGTRETSPPEGERPDDVRAEGDAEVDSAGAPVTVRRPD